jgi:nicotinamide mononucleotide transporter
MEIFQTLINQLLHPNPVEVVGVITGFISVYFFVKNRIEAWPWGIINVIAYGWVFYVSDLPANMGLQIFYFFPIQFYGWWMWAKGGPRQENDLPVSILTPQARLAWAGVTILLSILLGYLMVHYTKSALPYWDATTTAISIVAQYLQTRKIFENWALWILADIIYVFYLFPVQGLYLTTILYALFLLLAVQGYREWWRIYQKQQAQEIESAMEGLGRTG